MFVIQDSYNSYRVFGTIIPNNEEKHILKHKAEKRELVL